MMKRYLLAFSAAVLLMFSNLLAQSGVIRGRVYDQKNNEPMPFVNVIVVGENIGAASDLDGNS
jgi:hypothetical protein